MTNKIILKKGLKLGELDAEADADLLKSCFMDNGSLGRLLDIRDHAAIVLGRTGSGKSALLLQIKERSEHCCLLNPHNISINYLEYSNILQFLNELGINLDLFYKILWRHILIVELLKMRYNLHNEGDCKSFSTLILNKIKPDKAKKKALEYFSEWNDKFWLDVDEQLKELTEKFSRDIKSQLGSKYSELDISLEGAKSLSSEQRTEIKPRAKQVVSEIQIQRLNEVFELLAEHSFNDRQKSYYVLIDQLDENWAETETRHRFIRALIEEIKAFRNLPQVKIIIAMRQDLLELVFDRTRDSGFQEEKYEAYLLQLKWTKNELEQLIEMRINEIFKRQYTKDNINFLDIFPSPKRNTKETSIEYIISLTLLRPRDILQYINICFSIATERERVSWDAMRSAETTYSSKRLKSLHEEWGDIYPGFNKTVEILRGLPKSFTRSDIGNDKVLNVCSSMDDSHSKDPCAKACKKLCSPDERTTESDVLSELLKCLYHIGIIGIKISSSESCIWSYINQPKVSSSEVKRANQIKIHSMLYQALEIKLKV